MATKFPGSLDSDLELPSVYDNITEIGGEAINGLKDSVQAIEKNIGIGAQGNTADLTTRINVAIDSDGNIKSAALSGKGLVTLPINNAHISSSAAITESKLDLDYSTSTLNSDISTVSADLGSLRTAHVSLSSKVTGHTLGQTDKHDGYDVTIYPPLKDQYTIEAALNVLNNELEAHRSSSPAHKAIDITVPNEFRNISASNVQTALYELDVQGSGAVNTHQEDLHRTAIFYNGAAEIGTYGNLKHTTLAATIYETDTSDATNILQIMRPNAARITGQEIDYQALKSGSADTLRIYAGGIDRSYLDIALSSALPTDDLNDVIEVINYAAAQNNYPISAYNTGRRLTLAHNMVGFEFTIEVQGAASNSAHIVLGFGDSASNTVTWGDDKCGAVISGQKITDLNAIIKQSHTLAVSSDTIDPALGNLSLLGLEVIDGSGRVLVNITNHGTDSDYNGTYYIKSFPTTNTFILNKTILAGSFDLEVVKDSINFPNSARGEIYDIFVEYDADGYGKILKEHRASYLTLSGVSVSAINEDFPTNNVEWRITSTNNLQLLENTYGGDIVNIPSGFTGQIKTYSYDRVGSATFEVTGNPSSGTREIVVYPFMGSNERIYICSVHYSGNAGIKELKFVTDRRKLGATIDNYSYDTFENKTDLEQAIDDLRNNGIVYGFERLSNTSNSITIAGGRAYVGGRKVETKTRVVSIDNFEIPTGIVLLDKSGSFVIKNTLEPGFSFEELTVGDSYGDDRGYATVLEYSANGSGFDGYFYDRRLVIKNIDKRLVNEVRGINSRIDELEAAVSGSLWGFTVASKDGLCGSITTGANASFTAVGETGFSGGDATITTRKFTFSDAALTASNQFKSTAASYINVFFEAVFTDVDGINAFGTTGDANIYGGAVIDINGVKYDNYALLKQIDTTLLPEISVTERYVVSVPISTLYSDNSVYFMDIVPAIEIFGSTLIDGGGPGHGTTPKISFNDVRIVLSSYNISGTINEDTLTNIAQTAYIGDLL